MFVRFWLPITPAHASKPDLADLGFAFFVAFVDLGYGVRILPIGETGFASQFLGRWEKYSSFAMTVVPRLFRNVVCGPAWVFSGKHTVAPFVKNIAITKGLEERDNLSALKKYDQVWVSEVSDQDILQKQGIQSSFIEPNLEVIKAQMEGL